MRTLPRKKTRRSNVVDMISKCIDFHVKRIAIQFTHFFSYKYNAFQNYIKRYPINVIFGVIKIFQQFLKNEQFQSLLLAQK